ncbi:MAG: GC-type dockerin domain-anchored protein [Phycisphaerales bacterium]
MTHAQKSLLVAILAGSTGMAAAQPFAHNIAEPVDAREFASDLTLTESGDIIAAGGISLDDANAMLNGYLVASDADGVPFFSLIIDDPDSERDELIAVRQDTSDQLLIALQDAVFGVNPPTNNVLLMKIDPFAGALPYQWRYPITSLGENLGMELDQETGLVAASALNSFGGTQPTLLRFDNSTGLPIYHFRYAVTDAPAFDLRFYDVTFDPSSGQIFAVGTVSLDAQGFSPESELLIASFSPGGAPLWFNAYELRVEDNDDAGATEGTSIELNGEGQVVVTARIRDNNFGPIAAQVIVGPAAGAPIVASAISNPGAPFDPAFSSLEMRPNGTMLASGTTVSAAGTVSPVMWSFDGFSTALNWAYVPDVEDGTGNSAIPQSDRGPLLGGEVFPNLGTISGAHDLLLARTTPMGDGECPVTPDLRQLNVEPRVLSIPVQPQQMPNPEEAGVEVFQGEPLQKLVCEPCPADLAAPFGVLNFFDIAAYIALYNAMDPAADLAAPFGTLNFFDITAYIALYNAGCP